MGLLFFFGGYLIFGKIPNKLKKSTYAISRVVMGVANLVLAIIITVFYFFDIKSLGPFFSPVINLTSYFLISILIALSFIPLLGGTHHYTPNLIKISFIIWITYSITLWCFIFFCDENVINIALIVAALFFLLHTVGLITLFSYSYRDAVKSAENYYSDNIEVNISWMMRTIYFVVGLGLTGGLAAFGSFAPKWISTAYMGYTVFVFLYIFVCFVNFTVRYSDIISSQKSREVELIPEKEGVVPILKGDTYIQISKKITKWVEGKNYLTAGVNIQLISNQILTNRTYLSAYINSTYGISFKDWIASLRIEEAKLLMLEDRSKTVAEIAHEVGFASPTSFTRAFTRRETIPPLKWREGVSSL